MKRISKKNYTMKKRIYLDDVRTPVEKDQWVVVRDYVEFVDKVNEIGLENISLISLDHDLGETHRLPQNCVRVQIEHTVD